MAKKVNMSPGYMQKVRRERRLQSFKVGLTPNRSDRQNASATNRSRGETYVEADFNQLPGRQDDESVDEIIS